METPMKHVLAGIGLATLIASAAAGLAQAQSARQMRDYGWYGPYWGPPVHAANDFVANQLNRAVLGQIGLTGAVGLDKVALNPQPLPPKAR
jgi:hypothetical protein